MLSRIRNYCLVAIAAGIFYFFLTHHVLFSSFTQFDLLKKIEPTFKYTFISMRQINPYKLLRDDNLRDAGLAEYMLEKGLVSEARMDQIMQAIDAAEGSTE